MKRFLLHLFFYTLMVTLLLSIITVVTDKGLHKSTFSWYKDWNGVNDGTINADVLIMGSSHARRGINPIIIDSILHVNSYNLGMDGYMFDMQLARYNMYRMHNRAPKLIILCVDYYELSATSRFIDPEQFLPYLRDKGLSNASIKIGMPAYFYYLPFLKYQDQPKLVWRGAGGLMHYHEDRSVTYKGFYGADLHWNDSEFNHFMAEHTYLAPELNDIVVQQFHQFLDSCTRQQIKVVLVFTPHYYRFNQAVSYRSAYMAYLHGLAAAHHVPLLNFNSGSMCLDTRYFGNGTHLSRPGVTLFTRQLATALRERWGAQK